jgi:uncharacterized membrane protein YccC
MTSATVVAFLVAQAVGLSDPPPLIAALTALLVVQATLAGTLASSVQRVLSVVAGVGLAILFVSVVGLSWWSLGALVTAALVVGQLLRLGPNLVEVPISAMLVLGVGAAGAETVGAGRVVETLVGAAVGVLVNVLVPPAVRTRYAEQALERFAQEISGLLEDAAATMATRPITVEETGRWLDDARRLNRHAPRVDQALAHAEESRRLNLRALGTPVTGLGLREGLEALEHTTVSMRTLFRAVHDATRERTGVREDPGYADDVRVTAAQLMARMGEVVRSFGDLLVAETETTGGPEHEELAAVLAALRSTRRAVHDLLIADPRSREGLWELNSALLTTADRMVSELDAAEHARREAHRVREMTARRLAAQATERFRARNRPADDPRRSPTDVGPGPSRDSGS